MGDYQTPLYIVREFLQKVIRARENGHQKFSLPVLKITDNPMNSGNINLSQLNPQYFWDVDLTALDEALSCRLIIERVFSLGDMQEMNQVIHYYGKEKVIEIL